MTKVYDQHDAAFRNVSAFAILKDGKHVANITLKHGGAVTAYVHWIGREMVRGQAGGGGYDRASAAVDKAARKMPLVIEGRQPGTVPADAEDYSAFVNACPEAATGERWNTSLERAGFTIANVIG